MSETKFSPGPWIVLKVERCGNIHHWIGLSDLGPVAGIGGLRGDRNMLVQGMIDEHDAALIAAAPDLYEALEALCTSGGADDGTDLIANGLSALAKARGES